MLGKYLTVNGVQYPNPAKFSLSIKNNEAVNLSEVYTELVSVNRLYKFGFTATMQVTSYWRDKIIADCKKPLSVVTVDGETYTGRLRASGLDLEENSENTKGTRGLWTFKLTFTEL
ncbi:MAG: hypothetical protein MJ007_02825 [Paludibacteraceae bacterium]|nr:hypothetical protein [Paludibacteraceae bacterium]